MKEIATLVPQVFYDLIGRVAPGAAILFAAALLFVDPARLSVALAFVLKEPRIQVSVVLTGALLASYLTGLLLGGVGFAIADRQWRTGQLSWWTPSPPPPAEPRNISYVYDLILVRNPAAGARLAKLRAEAHMCRTLVVGAGVLAGAYALRRADSFPTPGFWLVIASLAGMALASYLLNVHLAVRTRHLMVNCWTLFGEPRSSGEQPTPEVTPVDPPPPPNGPAGA